MMEVNLLRWNEKALANQTSRFYDLEGFLVKKDSLLPIEIEEVGNVTGKDLLHLQCHLGMDTLSWAGRGAKATGVDFSPQAIRIARELSHGIDVPVKFIESDIYRMDSVLDQEFDIVYTSYGVLCWLPDLREWARLIAKRIRPGGFFYIVEGHPFGSIINDRDIDSFYIEYRYFNDEPYRFDDDHPIDEGQELQNKERFEWSHTISEVVNVLLEQGLRLDFLHEFPFCFFPMHPCMERGDDGYWHVPEGNISIPYMFSLKASRPDGK